jgi:hypothetical protein
MICNFSNVVAVFQSEGERVSAVMVLLLITTLTILEMRRRKV